MMYNVRSSKQHNHKKDLKKKKHQKLLSKNEMHHKREKIPTTKHAYAQTNIHTKTRRRRKQLITGGIRNMY